MRNIVFNFHDPYLEIDLKIEHFIHFLIQNTQQIFVIFMDFFKT